jgi:imidazolonepropionase-like amidohydrolase/glyoxylase-like metal-dependent hydrolase (beta-lactamase superfamily II)
MNLPSTLLFALTAAAPPESRLELVRLADGVWAATRKEAIGLAQNGNSLIVVGDRDVLVVDAQFTREATLETLAAVRSVTRRPVRWVVNTHWHDDHFAGNQVYRDTFPDVQFIIHANTRADLKAIGAPNRDGTKTGAPPLVEKYGNQMKIGLGIDSTPISVRERESLTDAIRIMNRYLEELSGFRETMDGPIVQDRFDVDLGKRPVEVLWLGRANTRGDLVVSVPGARVVATGDLLVHPIPFAFGSFPREWATALDRVKAMRPAAIVPGHGPVLGDFQYLDRVRAGLNDAHVAAQAAIDRGDSVAKATREISLDPHRQPMTGGEKWMEYMFENFYRRPTALAAAQQARTFRGATEPGTLAITNVNVIPMSTDTVLRNTTVLVRDGRVLAVGRDARVPAGARRVNGAGKYLIPGLADMHTHLYSDDDAVSDTAGPAELGVILANGVTAARIMIGTPEHLVLRRDVARGRVAGPQLFVASPHLVGRAQPNGITVTNEQEARDAVRRVSEAGYDMVKITLFITRPVYDAIVDEAAKRRIRVVGHIDPAVGVARTLETGQQIEHLDSYFEAALADSAPMKISVTQGYVFNPSNWKSLDYIDDRKLDQLAGATARARAWSSPTLNIFNTAFATGETDEAIKGRPDWDMLPPHIRDGYMRARERYWAAPTQVERTDARRRRYVEVRNKLVKAISDSGGRILAGSDTPEWLQAYGWGLHRELQALVQAGLTPYQALVSATRNPAEFLNQTNEWGTLEVGKRADFVLLSANPLADIRNTERIEAVGVGGKLLTRAELDRMIARGSRAINGAASRQD